MTPLERRVLQRAAESPGGRLRLVAHTAEERETLVSLIRARLVRVAGDPLRVVGVNLSLLDDWHGPASGPAWVYREDLLPPDPSAERAKAAMLAFVRDNPGSLRREVTHAPKHGDREDAPGLLDELVNAGLVREREEPGNRNTRITLWPASP